MIWTTACDNLLFYYCILTVICTFSGMNYNWLLFWGCKSSGVVFSNYQWLTILKGINSLLTLPTASFCRWSHDRVSVTHGHYCLFPLYWWRSNIVSSCPGYSRWRHVNHPIQVQECTRTGTSDVKEVAVIWNTYQTRADKTSPGYWIFTSGTHVSGSGLLIMLAPFECS